MTEQTEREAFEEAFVARYHMGYASDDPEREHHAFRDGFFAAWNTRASSPTYAAGWSAAVEAAARVCELRADDGGVWSDADMHRFKTLSAAASEIRAISTALDIESMVERGAVALAKMHMTVELANFPERARARAVVSALVGGKL